MSLLLFLQSLLVSVAAEIFRLPVTRIQRDPNELATRSGFRASMFDQYDNSYVTTIQVGVDQEEFRVVLDTGSGHFFIPSSRCGETCGEHKRYLCPNPSPSIVQLNYGTGEAVGNICTDTVTIAGLRVRQQRFVVVNSEDEHLRKSKFDGIMGLSYPMQSVITTHDGGIRYIAPVYMNLVAQKKIGKAFSFYMTYLDNADGSFVHLGGSDDNYYEGDLQYVPVVPAHVTDGNYLYKHWQVELSSFKFGDLELLNSTANVLIDSGTSDIIVSNDIYDAMLTIIGPYYSCDTAKYYPPITMKFGEHEFTLDGPDYLHMHGKKCIYRLNTIRKPSDMHSFIMGDVFFRKYYIEFNFELNMIGFAPSKHASFDKPSEVQSSKARRWWDY